MKERERAKEREEGKEREGERVTELRKRVRESNRVKNE